jgi:hypothetical protein
MLTKVSRSSAISFAFFHSLAELGRGVDSGNDSWTASSSSLRDLFFPVLVFMLLDGDAFILQVTGVSTRICSRAILAVDCGGAYRSNLLRAAVAAAVKQVSC